jgi:Tfp pilus assembly protein PilF
MRSRYYTITRQTVHEAIRLIPEYFNAHHSLGHVLASQDRVKEAEAEFREAIRLGPDISYAHACLGSFLSNQARFKEAAVEFSEAIRLKPDEVNYWSKRAWCAIRLGQSDKVVADLSQAIKLQPGNGEFLALRGRTYAELGQWQKATAELDEAMKCKQPHPEAWYLRALLYLRDGNLDGYRRICADMLQRFGKTDDADKADTLAWTCIWAPNAVADAAQPVHLAEKAVAKDPKSFSYCLTLGAALYRAGRFEDAIKRLTEASALKPDPEDTRAYHWFFLAMAHDRLRHADEARNWLEKALQETEKALKPSSAPAAGARENAIHPTGPIPPRWNRKLQLQLLRREAEEQIRSKG